ncbi:hypothetical protein like AT3G29760 [Hibiscus trionum]|uniref:Mitochondrial import inner membrane translocase subunit TIM50 n=1 Tax=Hibiscus trionum TaxID=183268 RepID=A0A9W7HFE8_HIBTR|nr:hypothetical protein like AT3G29760 [Hibiscus trionum]
MGVEFTITPAIIAQHLGVEATGEEQEFERVPLKFDDDSPTHLHIHERLLHLMTTWFFRPPGVELRPGASEFLYSCFTAYEVAIWSSRTRENLEWALWRINDLKPRLAFIWDQSHCEQHPSYPNIFTKNLRHVWDNMPQYNEGNTLLVDDSEAKMINNPENTYICPKSYKGEDETTHNALEIGGSIRVYLQNLAAADNVQEYVKHHPYLD